MNKWKPLYNYPGYEGSPDGQIRNVRTQRVLKPVINGSGVPVLSLQTDNGQRSVNARRVLAETFTGEHPGMDVRYRDPDNDSLAIDNLEWCTRSETIQRGYDRGTKKSPTCVRVRVVETGETYDTIKECAEATGCDKSDISKYLAGKRKSIKGLHFVRETPLSKP